MSTRARRHFLEQALLDGLRALDVPELLKLQIEHNSAEGEWESGVVSPSLVGLDCRLARLKKFLGHDPQPGLKHMGVRQGFPDPNSKINMLRGFNFEGIAVAALRHELGAALLGCAPKLLFRWRYQGDDPLLSMWVRRVKARGSYNPDGSRADELENGMIFAGHPDVMVLDPDHDNSIALVQVKCPRISKCERIKRMGPKEALQNYRAQMVTEMYIGRMMGWPIERSYLLVGTMEGNFTGAKHGADPYLDVIELPWAESMRMIPEEIARQLVQDADTASISHGDEIPMPYKESAWDTFPCSYCNYSRLGDFERIGCTEHQQWDQYAIHGTTRLTEESAETGNVVSLRRRRVKAV
jgi:hypothetical protein